MSTGFSDGGEFSCNESDTSLDERKHISRRSQIIDSSGDEKDDAYANAEKGKGTTEIDDTLSEVPSEVSSDSSQKRKGYSKRGNRRYKSKARRATSPATPSIPGDRLYVGDIPLKSTKRKLLPSFRKLEKSRK